MKQGFFFTSPPRKSQYFVQICQKFSSVHRVRYTHRRHSLPTSSNVPGHGLSITTTLGCVRHVLMVINHEKCGLYAPFWGQNVPFLSILKKLCSKMLNNSIFWSQKDAHRLHVLCRIIINTCRTQPKVAGMQTQWLRASNDVSSVCLR